MEIIHKVYFSIGSNQGDRFQFLQTAVNEISVQIGKILEVSNIYVTEPVGFISDDLFLNACLLVETTQNPQQIIQIINSIENNCGRKRIQSAQYSSRPLDIDILFFDSEIINTKSIQIPHPRLYERLFVLIPLNDINNELIDPISYKTIKQLLENCTDNNLLTLDSIHKCNFW